MRLTVNPYLCLPSGIGMASKAEIQSGTASFCHCVPPSPSNAAQALS